MQGAQPDRAFEVFVKRTLSTIQKESWGRSKECKELREMCQNVLNLLHDHEQGHLQYEGSLAVAVLEPLYLACTSSNPKILDAALGCLHKLVAHAWLQGESSSGGQVSDADVVSRVIRTVIRCGETSAIEGMQLAVIRALLTFTTAEHFVAHGDCLLAAVRMVFNLALGAEDDIIKRTASNALLQMLNTVAKRVTAYQLFGGSSTATSRRSSLDGSLQHSHSHMMSPSGGSAAAASASGAPGPVERLQVQATGRLVEQQQATEAALAAAATAAAARWVAGGDSKADPTVQPTLSTDSTAAEEGLLAPGARPSLSITLPSVLCPSEGGLPMAASVDDRAAAGLPVQRSPAFSQDGGGPATPAADGSRTAQLAILAEQRDIAGLEAALGNATSLDEGLNTSEEEGPVVGRVRQPIRSSGDGGGGEGVSSSIPAHVVGPGAEAVSGSSSTSGQSTGPTFSLRTCSLALPHGYVPPSPPPPLPPVQPSPGRSSGSGTLPSLPGLSSPTSAGKSTGTKAPESPFHSDAATEAQLATTTDSSLLTRTSHHSQRQLGHQLSHASSHQSSQHHHHHQHQHRHCSGGYRGHGHRVLRTPERDVLLVLTAFCRLASREGGVTDVDKYLAAGKLLALELVVKVLQNPIHCWDNVRDEFVRHLHQPLCLVLLRNCSPSDAAAFQLALKLLTAVLLQPKLRKGLKAELGAFYPLLLLRPLEVEQIGATELVSVASAMPCLGGLCSEPQLLVDLFVNYDCDLKAPNLYERTVQALSRLSQRAEVDGPPLPAGPKQQELAKQLASVREAAHRCLLSVVHCLDVWSAPLKEQCQEGAEKPAGAGGQQPGGRGAAGGQQDETRDSGRESGPGALAAVSSGLGAGLRANGIAASSVAGASEAERFEAVKVAKSSLTRGLSMFNGGNPVKAMRFLISSGVVEDSPAGVAVFLRAHASDLDPAAMGEYLGHHEDFELAAMHAYVDQERYGGLSIDVALRSFLLPFRLPGEAQKIDRLMEAFAERYVRDNPGVFRNADAAYVLAFAVIMLNTDAHNPLAERRLDRSGFVAMTSLPTEDGGGGLYEPALPVRELEGIYERIVAQEIVVRSTPGAGGGAGGAGGGTGPASGRRGGGGRGEGGNKLAAALGLRVLVAPFRNATAVDRKQVSNAERQRQQMMEVAELAVARGSDGSGAGTCLSTTWHTCTHAAHTRPMLTVSGEALTSALLAALPHAPDAEAVLEALVTLAELAGLMGLEELCEAVVEAVAAAASVTAPAPFGTAAAARQLAALRALLGAGASPGSGQLGSAWTMILRTASELEALVRAVARPLQPGETGVAFLSPPSAAAGGGATTTTGLSAATSNAGTSLLTKVFGGLWGGSTSGSSSPAGGGTLASNGPSPASRGGRGGVASNAAPSTAPVHKDGSALPPPPVRVMAGAAMVMWAVTDGRQIIEQVYTRSASLDGEAVVVFVRALCAVSREELDATRPRVYSLQRLVEVAHLNLAVRIRLIWSKLWTVMSAHLVMAACHGQQPIAAQAVNALRALAGRVLEREQLQLQRATGGVAGRSGSGAAGAGGSGGMSGLTAKASQAKAFTQSTWGSAEGSLRPFVAVLRLSDDPSVRAMALAAVAGIMTSHARGLGAGWRIAMEALRRAADDASLAVYEQALGALEVAVAALFRTMAVATTAAAPLPLPPTVVQHTAAGTAPVQSPSPPGHDCYRETLGAILTAICNPHHAERAPAAVQLLVQVGERLSGRPAPLPHQTGGSGDASSSGMASSYTSMQHMYSHQLPLQPLESAASGGPNGLLTPPSNRSILEQLAAPPPHSRPSTLSEDWALLIEVVADVAATPSAPRLAAAGLEASLDLMRGHSATWGLRAWRMMLHRVVAAVAFRVPPALDPASHPAEAVAATAAGLPLESISASFVARVERLFPLMCSQLAPLVDAMVTAPRDTEPYGRRRRWSFDSDGGDDDDDDSNGVGFGRRGAARGQTDLYRELLALLAETCLGWFCHSAEAVSRVGLSSLSGLLNVTGGVVLPLPSAAQCSSTSPAAAGSRLEQQHHQHLQRGWDVLVPLLSSTLLSELEVITKFAERLRRQQEQAATALMMASTPKPPFFSGSRQALEPEARRLRCRCRMAVLLQRTLCEYTARCAEHLPWSVIRQLVALLVGVAQRLMDFNMREDLPAELLQHHYHQLTTLQVHSNNERERKSEEGIATSKGKGGAARSAEAPVDTATDETGPADGWDDGWDNGWDEREEIGPAIRDKVSLHVDTDSGPKPKDTGDTELAGEIYQSSENGGGVATVALSARSVEDATQLSQTASAEAGQGGVDKADKLLAPAVACLAAAPEGQEPTEGVAQAGTATVQATEGDAATGPVLSGARLQLSGRQLQLTSATSHNSMRPALARLEVEAADAAITLLLACVGMAPLSDPSAASAAVERRRDACAQLESLCRYIIDCSVAAHALAAAAAVSSSWRRHAASPASPLEPTPLDPNLPGSSWDHAVRAAVLARAIHVLLMLGTSEGDQGTRGVGVGGTAAGQEEDSFRRQTWQLTLVSDLLVLLGSHQPVVRGAVADYLEAVVGPRLLKVLAQ